MDKNQYLTQRGVLLRYLPMVLVIIADIICLIVENVGVLALITFFGGLTAIGHVIIGVQMSRNISLLNEKGLYTKMLEEMPPDLHGKGYAVTDTFVFGYNRRLCLPIADIKEINPGIINYINSAAKDKAWLTVHMIDGEKYDLIYFNGFLNERKTTIVKSCVTELFVKNPRIIVRRK